MGVIKMIFALAFKLRSLLMMVLNEPYTVALPVLF